MIELKTKQIFRQLNSLEKMDMKSFKALKNSKNVLNFMKNHHYIKFYSKTPYVNVVLNDGFLVSIENLNQLFSKDKVNKITGSLDFITNNILKTERIFDGPLIYAPKILIYVPFDGDIQRDCKAFIVMDLRTSFWIISDIPELGPNNSDIICKKIPSKIFYNSDLKIISSHIDDVFFGLFLQYNPGSTYDDFIVSLMEHI
jgi:hypothetical protein